MQGKFKQKLEHNTRKWNMVYVLLIVANLLFAVVFYILSAVYGGN